MTDPRARDSRNPHYQQNCDIPDGEALKYKTESAAGESWEEWSERVLRPEPDFPGHTEEDR